MVYCCKCGMKNEDDAEVCVKCGEPLYTSKRMGRGGPRGECFEPARELEEECFGLPYGGALIGMIAGIILIVIGFAIYFGVDVWRVLWPTAIIIVGVLIIIGALRSLARRR